MLRRFLLVSAFLAFGVFSSSLPLRADEDVAESSLDSSGYTLGEGDLWWKDGNAYTRELVEGEWYSDWAWDRHRCCWVKQQYRRASHWRFKQVLNRRSVNRWSQLSELAFKHQDDVLFAQALTRMFPQQNSYSNWSASQTTMYHPGNQNFFINQLPHGQVNLNEAYQQLGQVTGQLPGLLDNAYTNYAQAYQITAEGNARIAEIQANGLAMVPLVAALAKAIQPQASTTTTTEKSEESSSSQTTADAKYQTFFQTVLSPSCAECHSKGKTAVAKFDVDLYQRFTPAQKAHVWAMIAEKDDAKRMPKGKPRLSSEKILSFLDN